MYIQWSYTPIHTDIYEVKLEIHLPENNGLINLIMIFFLEEVGFKPRSAKNKNYKAVSGVKYPLHHGSLISNLLTMPQIYVIQVTS